MAATDIQILWDQAGGSEVMIAIREAGYAVRCGRVLGLTAANTTSETALTDVVLGSGQVPPTHPDTRLAGWELRYAIVRGDSQTTGMIWAHYAPLNFSGVPIERLAFEIGGGIEYEEMERMPETGEPFNVQLPDSDSPEVDVTLGDFSTVSDLVTLQTLAVPRVTKVLSLYGMFSKVPPNIEGIENRVNDAAWPPAGPGPIQMGLGSRPIGHWKAGVPNVRWSSRDGLFALSLTIASKGKLPGEDWSSYKFSQDPTTGKHLSPSPALMTKLMAQEYAYGIRNNGGGVLKVGLLRTSNFSAILGPILNNSPLRPTGPFQNL